jgi:2-polyprenyl-3-methyl-5-hydroxy-6-metoxy-1,4-benzoquinol methylase
MYLVYSGWFGKIRKQYFKKLLVTCKLSGGMSVLDYGCGPGDLLIVAKDMGFETQGVDAFSRSVDIARARGLSVALGDAKTLNYPDNSLDAIVLQSVIEHMNNPLEELSILAKLLRPGGVLVVSAPTPGAHFWDDPTHIRPYTPASLKILGELLDLRTEYVSYVFSFLLGIRMTNSLIYKVMNIFSIPLGSNLIAIYRKP